MKHKFNILIITIAMCFTLVSCEDFFNIDSQDFVSAERLFSTEKGATSALNGVYYGLNNRNLYRRVLINDLDVSSNDLCWGNSSSPTGLPSWGHSPADREVTNTWFALYEGIDRANVFLENIKSVPNMTDDKKQLMIAQARFLRALYYYNLVQNWGAVPLKLNSTKSPEDSHVAPSSAETVFEAIHIDLDSAIRNLPNRLEYPELEQSSRPSKTTAMALKARTYLRQAGIPFNIKSNESYALAAKYANDVIASGVHSLNPSFKDIFINLLTDKYDHVYNENLMEIEFAYNDIHTNLAEFPSIGAPLKYAGQTIIRAGSAVRTTKKLFDLYEKGPYTTTVIDTVTHYYPTPKDERRDWTIQDYKLSGDMYGALQVKYSPKFDETNPLNDLNNKYYRDNLNETPVQPGRFVGKWRRDYENASTLTGYGSPCNFPLIRYAEVLLIFAEADVMSKNSVSSEALDALNQVRERANASKIESDDQRAINPSAFLLEIRDERARELFGEGHRRHDLIRWGILLETFANLPMDDPTISNWGRSIQDEKFLLLPYPEREVSTNLSMKGKQNPGW